MASESHRSSAKRSTVDNGSEQEPVKRLRSSSGWAHGARPARHILTAATWTRDELAGLIARAVRIKANPAAYRRALDAKTLLMLFEKPSLRTRVSFETGMSLLGGHAIFYSLADSPLPGKETWEDTGAVLSRLCHVVMARVRSRQSLLALSANCTIPVINGLDDWGHPCQILADFMTIAEQRQQLLSGHAAPQSLMLADDVLRSLAGVKMAYVGDTRNNVTYDLARAAAIFGIDFRMAGPPGDEFQVDPAVLQECEALSRHSGATVSYCHDAREAVSGVHVIYTDSWMSYGITADRAEGRRAALLPFQVTDELLACAHPDCIFMNCLPAWRGNEQTASVIDGPHSVVFDEAENRLWAQMSLLIDLLGDAKSSSSSSSSAASSLEVVPGRVVVALGGNALSRADETANYENLCKNVAVAARALVAMVKQGRQVVVTHGNGPQVGAILLQNQEAAAAAPEMPLAACGAESQGLLGSVLVQALHAELAASGLPDKDVVAVVTHTEVQQCDPAFEKPTKPVGKYYTQEEAERIAQRTGQVFRPDAAGRGYRVAVASPAPVAILERHAIRTLVDSGAIVVAAGGGGVPVSRATPTSQLQGRTAVVDKDHSAVLLAQAVGAQQLIVLTDVDCCFQHFGTPAAQRLASLSVGDARRMLAAGEFGVGSMQPKVAACVQFVSDNPACTAVIANLENALDAVADTPIKATVFRA